ncbi:hypothetical protein SAMN05421805_101630 [Saccharopolyspora antimicrobica]|uniref:Alcohol dehydrogenase n=1 Tax=Saccharopolyspora antimicrobica TaxID=455193 RepID=A0A1I4RNK0_9PSEU|nr:hypothetical protein [Saccharopolyspora antimicrobica]RKT87938.1 hypothetical protein ATL45_6361 [Saccharopolyspora antimicrobica]SFM53812.1 hypothetical protein SAMN05421805_101630 [Saccharopolyspora antimicrobica]
MRAIVLSATPAGPAWLERHDLEPPVPEDTEVVVEVRAAALNHADLDELAGTYASAQRRQDRPHIAGSDLAAGKTVLDFRRTDESEEERDHER